MQAFRFVVIYRGEEPVGNHQKVCWRGWVEQVFPEPETDQPRRFFQDPAEVSNIISDAVKHVAD